jgi:hypothetical protein
VCIPHLSLLLLVHVTLNRQELERYPIEIDVKVRIISFWTKLCCGKESKLSVIIYRLSFQMSVVDRCKLIFFG